MAGLVPAIHALFHHLKEDVDARVIKAFTYVFDGLCPRMTMERLCVMVHRRELHVHR
jgi:hypothetical protein